VFKKGIELLKPLVMASFVCIGVSWGLTPFANPHRLFSILFFFIIFLVSAVVISIPSEVKAQTQKLLALSVVRLLMALMCILIYGIKNTTNAYHFSIHFMLHFVIFLTFDTVFLVKSLNKKEKK
jgi:MFS-type transporter involved in bile tolerance (Atg22 family)